jgi:hypothetical protein
MPGVSFLGSIHKVMMLTCPHCGSSIPEALNDGLAACCHCNRVFDSSLYNSLLSASWYVRKNRCHGVDQLISDTKLSESEAILVYAFVSENNYSHDEFQKALGQLGIRR